MSDDINNENSVPDKDEKSIKDIKPSNITPTENITVKKSTFKILIVGIMVCLITVSFFGGYTLGNNSVAPLVIQDNQGGPTATQPTQTQDSGGQRIFVSLSDDPSIGDKNAPVTIVEFSDFQCPFCQRFFSQTLPQIEQDYISKGKVRLIFRDFPIESIHPNARVAAIAAECADDQKMFWQYHNQLFESQTEWAGLSSIDVTTKFKQYANYIGLNSEAFNSCVDSAKPSSEIGTDLQSGVNYGVTGTPAFFIGNDKDGYVTVIGAKPYASFKQIIDQELS